MIYGELRHDSHRHNLKLVQEKTPYTCNACHEIGFHSRYRCNKPSSSCNFHLHKECAFAERTITHSFFPKCVFEFRKLPELCRCTDRDCRTYCDACGRDIQGYNYHCSKKGVDLHPCCAKLPDTYNVKGDLTLKLKRKLSSECYKCGEKEVQKKRKSWSYVTTYGECYLHVACVKDMLLENWEKECLGHVDGEKVETEASDAKALVKKAPRLEIVLHKGKRSEGERFAKYMKIAKIAWIVITSIMRAVVGDPSAPFNGLFSFLIGH